MNHTFHVCLRRALVWLMLLAIPFQGVVAAGMVACAHASAQYGAAMTMPAMDHGAVQTGHCHDANPSANDPAPLDNDHGQDQERCSACAACCIGAAMAGAPTLPAAPPTFSIRLIDAATGRLEAVDLALPERPPRLPLA
ncbi:hypothetical protein AB2N08_14340 [Massilia aurea]|uniref:hypothetical protein n=1 Tax=Massilia aurea TaxID=373040 RepID=UPI0034628B45